MFLHITSRPAPLSTTPRARPSAGPALGQRGRAASGSGAAARPEPCSAASNATPNTAALKKRGLSSFFLSLDFIRIFFPPGFYQFHMPGETKEEYEVNMKEGLY
ncbi:unnamed protein product [Caenorhabditis brenneri]